MAKATVPTSLDILADAQNPESSAKDLQQAVTYAEEMLKLEAEQLELSQKLKDNKERYDKLQLELLPDVMLAIGVKKFALSNGFMININDFVRGSIPTAQQIASADEMDRGLLETRRTEALKWLRAVGADSLIKNQVIAQFGKGQDEAAKKLLTQLEKDGYVAKCEEEVNFMTLNSYLKSALAAGKQIPADAFSLFVGKKATLKKEK